MPFHLRLGQRWVDFPSGVSAFWYESLYMYVCVCVCIPVCFPVGVFQGTEGGKSPTCQLDQPSHMAPDTCEAGQIEAYYSLYAGSLLGSSSQCQGLASL